MRSQVEPSQQRSGRGIGRIAGVDDEPGAHIIAGGCHVERRREDRAYSVVTELISEGAGSDHDELPHTRPLSVEVDRRKHVSPQVGRGPRSAGAQTWRDVQGLWPGSWATTFLSSFRGERWPLSSADGKSVVASLHPGWCRTCWPRVDARVVGLRGSMRALMIPMMIPSPAARSAKPATVPRSPVAVAHDEP